MNLDHLQTLVSIVEHGSLSAAARARRISQPAVTKQLQRMESEVGLGLLARGPKRQVELTPAGELVLVFARETLAHYEALERELAALKIVGPGVLSLAASTIPGEYLLPGLLAAFRAQYPQVEVQMSISDTASVAADLLADKADVGVIGSAIEGPGLRLERLVGDEIVLAVPADHPFARKGKVSVSELRGQPLILREEGSGTRRSVEAALAAAGASLPQDNVVLVLGSTQAILQAVTQELGVGFVSARALASAFHGDAQAAGELVSVSLEGIDLRRNLYLAYVSERVHNPVVVRFLNFARSQFEPASDIGAVT